MYRIFEAMKHEPVSVAVNDGAAWILCSCAELVSIGTKVSRQYFRAHAEGRTVEEVFEEEFETAARVKNAQSKDGVVKQ